MPDHVLSQKRKLFYSLFLTVNVSNVIVTNIKCQIKGHLENIFRKGYF